MRALYFDGRRDQCVDVPAWVRLRAESDVLVLVTCTRCGSDERIDVHCGSAEARKTAGRTLGRFAVFHDQCREHSDRPVRGEPPLSKYSYQPSTSYIRR